MKNIKPLFDWAKANGESKIVDRILLKLLPELLKYDQKMTADMVENAEELLVEESLYILVKQTAENIVGDHYE
ncbi:MAG: hypothetical protein Q7T77_09275 [Sulfuricurvum sp.]|nr:hypothetical protein [Sulfuricurvum sp.]